jgi:hypothetical protein
MKRMLVGRLGALALIALAAKSAAQAPAPQAKVIEAQGDAFTADLRPLRADQILSFDAVVKLGANASLRFADPCGDIDLIEGPREGRLGALIGAEGALPAGCKPPADGAAMARRQLAQLFLDQSPTRVLRGARTSSGAWDLDMDHPGAACVASNTPPLFSGDREALGDTLEVSDLGTGASGLSFFDDAREGWIWPDDVPIHAGEFRVASKLQSATFRTVVVESPPRDPEPLARRLMSAGCTAQALRLLPLLAPDRTVRGSR